MDSVPSSRNNNQPFSIDHTPPATSFGTHSFYYKQYPNSPVHLTSEWSDNIQAPVTAHEHLNPSPDSPSMLKMTAGVAQLLEDTLTPSRKPTNSVPRSVPGSEPVRTPGKPGSAVLSGPPPSSSKTLVANSSSRRPLTGSGAPTKTISTIDVFWAMLNDLTGKDKMAKCAQYSLRLLLHHARKTQAFLSDEKVNVSSINSTYASNEKVASLLVNFLKNPRAFSRVLVILICSMFSSRLAGFVPALGIYRQLLRFGKSPFRLHGILEKVRSHMYKDPKGHTWKISDKLFTKSTLGDLISFYYNINDDIGLLYKVRLLRNKSLQVFAGHHEAYAWYCDSWLGLYNAYTNLQKYSQQEFDLKISIQVKQRSRMLSRQVLGTNSLQANASQSDDEAKDIQALKDIQFRINNTKLDIYKLISDIIFNSYTVFNARLHFDTVQIWMGISASLLGSIKLFREKKKALTGA
ncbi:hypothetical protein JCM33374_g2521 [Metschnikowia sp. JCM 33374]|nr:hypothetical protein JCM33374_g2521 [Metschnikowia sp. JCM 33374]